MPSCPLASIVEFLEAASSSASDFPEKWDVEPPL